MLVFDDFEGNLEAYLRYLRVQKAEERTPALFALLQRPAARKGLASWSKHAQWLVSQNLLDATDAASAAIELLVSGDVESGRDAVDWVSMLVEQAKSVELASTLCAWLGDAGPGDGVAVADALHYLVELTPADAADQALVPAVAVLLRHHGGVLRSTSRARLWPTIVRVVRDHLPDELAYALRQLGRVDEGYTARMVDTDVNLWRCVETTLERGEDLRVEELFGTSDRLNSWLTSRLEEPLVSTNLPRARRWMADALVREAGSALRAREGLLDRALAVAPKIDASVSDAMLREIATAMRNTEALTPGHLEVVESTVFEWIRRHGLTRPTGPADVLSMAEFPSLQGAVRKGIEAWLVSDDGSYSVAQRILSEDSRPELIHAAVQALPRATQKVRGRASDRLDEASRAVVRLVAHGWLDSLEGVDLSRLLRGCRSARLVAMDGDDKVRVDPPELLFAIEPIEELVAVVDRSEVAAAALLYAAHELVHLVQGIPQKEQVVELRSAGAETTLMHLDLYADHVAAVMVDALLSDWSLARLKALEARLLANFPVSRFHPPRAMFRKRSRFESLVVDSVLREQSPKQKGYFFCEWNEREGPFAILASGPPVELVRLVRVDRPIADAMRRASQDADVSGFRLALAKLV